MEYPFNTPQEYMAFIGAYFSALELTEILDIDDAHIYRAFAGDYTDTFVERLRRIEAIPPKTKRTRLCIETDVETKRKFRIMLKGERPEQWLKEMVDNE